MACCFGKKPQAGQLKKSSQPTSQKRAVRPQIMLKETIPLSLGLAPSQRWEVELQEGARTQKRDPVSQKVQLQVKEEIGELEVRLNKLQRESAGQIEREKALDEEISKYAAHIRGMECLIAKEKIEIYKFQDKIAGKQ